LHPFWLTPDEDKAAFVELAHMIASSLRPLDPIAAGYARIVIADCWEVLRLRRTEASLYGGNAQEPEPLLLRQDLSDRLMNPTEEQKQERERERQELIERLDTAYRARLNGEPLQGRISPEPSEYPGPLRPPTKPEKPKPPSPEDDAKLVQAFRTNRAALALVQRLIRQAEVRRDRAIEDLARYTSTWVDPVIRNGIVDAAFQEVPPDELPAKAQSQPPQRKSQHRSDNRRRKAASKSERAETRARGSR
jgi:hypothetical protein